MGELVIGVLTKRKSHGLPALLDAELAESALQQIAPAAALVHGWLTE